MASSHTRDNYIGPANVAKNVSNSRVPEHGVPCLALVSKVDRPVPALESSHCGPKLWKLEIPDIVSR